MNLSLMTGFTILSLSCVVLVSAAVVESDRPLPERLVQNGQSFHLPYPA